jgi:hypothetical protein
VDTKQVLGKGVEVIVFLFAAFGGFLNDIAPPGEADSRFAIGVGSFLALIVLLLATAFSKDLPIRRYKKTWLTVASAFFLAAICAALFYKSNTDRLTFPYPPESTRAEYVSGTELTSDARAYKEKTGKTTAEVVAAYGGLASRERVWTPASIRRGKMVLVASYLALILSLASSIFCLTEGVLGKHRGVRRRT